MKDSYKFHPKEFEEKWQKEWEEKGVYQPDLTGAKRPFYNLMMFPYPSAEGLHVGNMYAFTGADIYGRFKRMQGYDVFEPIGLDGFGIHSENYAIKIGKHPAEQAKVSEKNFYRQLHAIGNGFAWKNKLETYDPDYYRWTQWIFIQMFKNGLAYRKKSPVNFCPSCKTVLSDEQVIDGACERCKSVVEKRDMEQWYFRITKYAEKLLQNTYRKDFHWVEKVKTGQRNWIGKSEGVTFRYKVKDLDIYFEMFDSVPQTFMAQTFTVIAPEHSKLPDLVRGTQYERQVLEFVERIKKKKAAKKFDIEKETEGVFTGRYIEYTPAKRLIPIWVASFVIADYGTGVVNASAHDERDFIFAKKYNLPLHPVMFPEDPKEAEKVKKLEYCYHHAPSGVLTEPQEFIGRKWGEVRSDIIAYIERHGWGKRTSQYHLRDWCISRQRYWGAPIPMIFCKSCQKNKKSWENSKFKIQNSKLKGNIGNWKLEIGNSMQSMIGWYPVPEDQLPVLLPADVADWKPEGTGKGPLAKIESFVKTSCPKCGGQAERETDVCDTFLDSSWYHMRYPSVGIQNAKLKMQNYNSKFKKEKLEIGNWKLEIPWDPQITRKWLPVTQYIGGAEHTVLHLLYARFVWMCFHDWGCFNFSAKGGPASGWEEPYTRFYAHGLIIAEGAKMSKSRGNVVIPDEYIRAYGADALRTYLMFLGPFDMGGDFRDTGIAGMYRFLNRVWRIVLESLSPKSLRLPKSLKQEDGLKKIMHRTIKEVTQDMENLRYNTAIAHIMEYVNEIQKLEIGNARRAPELEIAKEAIKTLLLLLAPFAPHMAEELWQRIHSNPKQPKSLKQLISIHKTSWPVYDHKYLVEDEVTIIVQVNGKTRDVIKIKAKDISDGGEGIRPSTPRAAGKAFGDARSRWRNQKAVEEITKRSEKVKKYISGQKVRNIIFVPGKLINFVI